MDTTRPAPGVRPGGVDNWFALGPAPADRRRPGTFLPVLPFLPHRRSDSPEKGRTALRGVQGRALRTAGVRGGQGGAGPSPAPVSRPCPHMPLRVSRCRLGDPPRGSLCPVPHARAGEEDGKDLHRDHWVLREGNASTPCGTRSRMSGAERSAGRSLGVPGARLRPLLLSGAGGAVRPQMTVPGRTLLVT